MSGPGDARARPLPGELARLLHDVRGPLNSAVMHLEVVKRVVAGTGRGAESLDIALDQLTRLAALLPSAFEVVAHDLGARDEGQRLGVGIVPTRKVPVERRNDRVAISLLDVVALPLADAGAAGVGEDGGAYALERLHLAVPADGGVDHVAPGRDQKPAPHGEALGCGLLGDVGRAADVLVRRVRAASDERRRDAVGIVFPAYVGG